jgi:hypothetical protein
VKKQREKIIDALIILGKRYVNKFLTEIDLRELQENWYESFKFFLDYVYYQGRSDYLSKKYLRNMKLCLDNVFLPEPSKSLKDLWDNHHIPHNQD